MYNESRTYTKMLGSRGGGTMTDKDIRQLMKSSPDKGFKALFDEY